MMPSGHDILVGGVVSLGFLMLIAAAELWRRGYRQLSVDVLNQGIRLLSGSPGISRLVNQLIDQQQR